MAGMEILIVTEGATEREVGKVLHDRGILSPAAKPRPAGWISPLGQRREGYEQVIGALKEKDTLNTLRTSSTQERLLLIFDQEEDPTPQARVHIIGSELGLTFTEKAGYANLFECKEQSLHTLLHISNPDIPAINRRDFDGYILQLLQSSTKTAIARKLLDNDDLIDKLLQKAEQEIPDLMHRNNYPWTHTKSWLYAYITAFQFRQSHVWFAGEVIRHAPEDQLRNIFRSLITAWDILVLGDLP